MNPATGGQTIVSSGGLFVNPLGVAIDAAGNIIVVDQDAGWGGGMIIRVDPATGAQTTISSGGFFEYPYGVALDAAGNIIVAEVIAFGGAIIKVNPVTGDQTFISSAGFLVNPAGLAIVPVPEPGSLLLLCSGLAGTLGYGVRRFRAARGSR